MPWTMDVLLFWAGLILTVIGVIVFITGKSVSAEQKKDSNRFEAFGIKVDVSNPSLLLIILGVVLMLVPRMAPKEDGTPHQLPQSLTPEVEQSTEIAKPSFPTRTTGTSLTENTVAESSPVLPGPVPPGSSERLNKNAAPRPAQPRSEQPKRESEAVPQLSTKPTRTGSDPGNKSPGEITKIVQPLAKTEQPPEPTSAPTLKTADLPATSEATPETGKRVLLVMVQADVNRKAGIRNETPVTYSEKIGRELAKQASKMLTEEVEIRHDTIDALRPKLSRGQEQYAMLCRRFSVELLLLADLEVPFSLSNIESSYWPDLELHLVNCIQDRSRRQVKQHLNPRMGDSFPFQLAIGEAASDFLADYRSLAR